MINRVIILGGHIQALGLLRQVKAIGIYTVLVIPDKFSVAQYSKYLDEVLIFGDNNKLLHFLCNYQIDNTLLFPTSDEYIELLNDNRLDLEEYFQLALPSKECVNIFSNKILTYKFSKEYSISHPLSWCPENLEDLYHIADNIPYPIVIKPAIMYSFHHKFGKKAFLCIDKKDLVSKCEYISKSFDIKDIILQEYLSGGAKTLFSYGTFAVDGIPKAWIIANRIRQNPMDFGNSTTFAIKCDIPEIEIQAKKILSAINYTGLAEVEFMYDEKTNKYKFLEINTRAWKWHYISKGDNFGFLSEMIKYYNNQKLSFVHTTDRFAWVERLTDFSVAFKEIIKGKMTASEFLRSYKIRKVSAVWNIKDLLPSVMYLILSPILFIKRH